MNGITITQVRVVDGDRLSELTELYLEDGIFSPAPTEQPQIIDGGGATLIPGLIDAHAHVDSVEQLEQMISAGVTTILDMGAPDTDRVNRLRAIPGLPHLRSALAPASAPGAFPTALAGFPSDSVVAGPEDAERAVEQRVAAGADYLKIIVEDPRIPPHATLDVATIQALTNAARSRGLTSIAHASAYAAVVNAIDGGVDVLTHVPLDRPIDTALAERIATSGITVVPTLIMMRGVAEAVSRMRPGAVSYDNAVASVAALRKAGVKLAVGTDANAGAGSINRVAHGTSLHDELELLVEAGLSPAEAIAAATRHPASIFGLPNRGSVTAGFRADFLLLQGDPTQSIGVIRNSRRIFLAGIEQKLEN